MSNMSYCRFHNTRIDLEDCLDALREEKRLSEGEAYDGRHLFDDFLSFCKEQGIIEDYDQDEIDTMFSRLEREEDDDDEDC